MENSMVRQRYVRRSAVQRRRRRDPRSGGRLRLLIIRQIFICVLLLIMIGIFKSINISATNFVTDKVKYVLNYNIEIKNIFSSVEKFAADIKKSISPEAPDKSDLGQNQQTSGSGSDLAQNSSNAETLTIPGGDADTSKDTIPDWENITAALSSEEPAQDQGLESTDNANGNEINDTVEPVGSVLSASTETGIQELSDMLLPVEGTLGTQFGELNKVTGSGKTHTGIDINVKQESRVISVLDGKVTDTGSSPAYGKYIRIIHSGGLQTVYANCSDISVEKGAIVEKGDVIADIGANGTSAGIHLHFEVWKDGIAADPLEFISVPVR